MTHCLLVDDDDEIRSLLVGFLPQFDIAVSTATAAGDARRLLEQTPFDIVVADVVLPGESGLDLCRWIATRLDVPVILLSAQFDAIGRVLGLELGADDCLDKPFEPRELAARIQAIVRRRVRGEQRARSMPGRVVRFAGWRLDRVTRRLTSPDDRVVVLSNAEFRMLCAFLDHPGRLLHRDQLIEFTKAPGIEVNDRSIDLCVSRLRQKMASADGDPALIRTVRGEGYFFDGDVLS
jgi:two-component system OmpR family response regulator